ncbi:MAG TPA: DUF2284 domain-containing protein [Methanocella sp.]|nr:DUF2284 domain-containing protein [Methanocella sp.]
MPKTGNFAYLEKLAVDLGATSAKVVPAGEVAVEDRVVLKCRAGCISYGTKLNCPPNVPTPEEFRKVLGEYSYVMLVKFRSPAVADPVIAKGPYKCWLDPAEPQEVRDRASKFWSDYLGYSKTILEVMLELEKAAFNRGNTFALAFVNGSCRLCEKCNVEKGVCLHPTRARIPEHAVGINMKKTAERAGMGLKFPVEGHPEPMAILLID